MLNVAISRSPLLPQHPAQDDILSALLTSHTFNSTPARYRTPLARIHCPLSSACSHNAQPSSNSLPPKETLQLLSLLDRLDMDVSSEVARVKEGIRETRELINQYKQARAIRKSSFEERKLQEKHDTREIDSEFWLGI